MGVSADHLADAIDAARASRRPLSAGAAPWDALTRTQAERVAELLYERWGAVGSPYWKLGAVDGATQARLGLDGPVCAPVVPTRVLTDVTHAEIDSSDFLHAKFEAEIGVLVGPDLSMMPCVEIADSRFEAWRLPPFGVVADGCLQSMLVFGSASTPQESISVEVRHDSDLVASGRLRWQVAVERLAVLPGGCAATHVATGAVTELIDVTPGEWTFDFRSAGRVSLAVR
jgi:2-keto-4-pentenoate hydratase